MVKITTSPVSTLKTEADMATWLKNGFTRTVKAHIALGALPDHDGDDDDYDFDDDGDDDAYDDQDGDGDIDDNPPVRLLRASQPQFSSQACRLLFSLARLNQHVILPHYYIMASWLCLACLRQHVIESSGNHRLLDGTCLL